MSENNAASSETVEPAVSPIAPYDNRIAPRAFVSILVALIAATILSAGNYFLRASIDSAGLEIALMTVMYVVGAIVSIGLRMAGRMKILDLLLFVIFGVIFALVGSHYVSSALAV